jgi:hypothetical protein
MQKENITVHFYQNAEVLDSDVSNRVIYTNVNITSEAS